MHTLNIVGCYDHGEEVVLLNGNIIYQDDTGTEILFEIGPHLGFEVTYESISGDEYEKRYA